jgi:hypothetical protein
VQLQVHLIQRLLNALGIGACRLHQAVTMPQQGTERTDLLCWPKRSQQQAHRMQILQPLAIGYVGLSPGHVLYMMRTDQTHLEATLLRIWKSGTQNTPVDSIAIVLIRQVAASLLADAGPR